MYPITEARKEEILLENKAKAFFLKHQLQFMTQDELHELQCRISSIMLSRYNDVNEDNERLRSKFL